MPLGPFVEISSLQVNYMGESERLLHDSSSHNPNSPDPYPTARALEV